MLTDAKVARSVAIHEAGHTVASIALGHRFRHVTVQARGDSAGHVRILPPRLDAGLEAHFSFLIRALAGQAAEREFGFRPQRYRWEEDRNAAVDHALEIAGDGKEAGLWVRIATIRARRLVSLWRPSIEAVAARLIADKTLDWSTARAVALQARGVNSC